MAQEEERHKALTTQNGNDNQINPLGSLIDSAESVSKSQEELKELELQQNSLDKEKSAKMGRQQKLKEDLAKFAARVDGLLRNQNLNRMQLRNIKNQIRQKVDEAQLNMTPIGLDDAALEEVQSQVLQDEFDLASLTSKLNSFLVGKVDQIASSLDIRTVDQIQDVSS